MAPCHYEDLGSLTTKIPMKKHSPTTPPANFFKNQPTTRQLSKNSLRHFGPWNAWILKLNMVPINQCNPEKFRQVGLLRCVSYLKKKYINTQVTPIDLLTASDLQFLQCLQASFWSEKESDCVVCFFPVSRALSVLVVVVFGKNREV